MPRPRRRFVQVLIYLAAGAALFGTVTIIVAVTQGRSASETKQLLTEDITRATSVIDDCIADRGDGSLPPTTFITSDGDLLDCGSRTAEIPRSDPGVRITFINDGDHYRVFALLDEHSATYNSRTDRVVSH